MTEKNKEAQKKPAKKLKLEVKSLGTKTATAGCGGSNTAGMAAAASCY